MQGSTTTTPGQHETSSPFARAFHPSYVRVRTALGTGTARPKWGARLAEIFRFLVRLVAIDLVYPDVNPDSIYTMVTR